MRLALARRDERTCMALLAELRRSGSSVWIEPEDDDPASGVLVVSPPAQPVAWPTDVEKAVEGLHDELYALVAAEDRKH